MNKVYATMSVGMLITFAVAWAVGLAVLLTTVPIMVWVERRGSALIQDRLGQAIHQAERRQGQVAVLFLDLDRFKPVNDTLGHHAGDELLKIVAERLSSCVREVDTVARIGGDTTRGDRVVATVHVTGGDHRLAMAMAVAAMAKERVRRIILTRPAVEAGENLGFLPGDLQEKVDPYLRPLYDALEDMMPADRVRRALADRFRPQ